jgi:hypothetical protein
VTRLEPEQAAIRRRLSYTASDLRGMTCPHQHLPDRISPGHSSGGAGMKSDEARDEAREKGRGTHIRTHPYRTPLQRNQRGLASRASAARELPVLWA